MSEKTDRPLPPRLAYHFEPEKGWINDPNGLIQFKGQYHAFFQHNPYAPKWGPMHWGHAISDDLVHWQEMPIALVPDQPYENSGGCFSGSAIEKDGKLFLFYTSVSKELEQTQSMAVSEDGIHFVKYAGNPIIATFPPSGSDQFRDPKVVRIDQTYYMVIGSGQGSVGKILLYRSDDLINWIYVSVLFEGSEYGAVLECPDLFPFADKFMLMFSQIGKQTHSAVFIYGDFDGVNFVPISYHTPEAGPQFYAPQTFLDDKNRRIMIAWLYDWHKKLDQGATYAGALTLPRELTLINGRLCNYPVAEAWPLLQTADERVQISDDCVRIVADQLAFPLEYHGSVETVAILRDSKTIEVFINHGEHSFTYWFGV